MVLKVCVLLILRAAYIKAIEQAAEVSVNQITDNNTKRWFHVTCELDDFSPYNPEKSNQKIVEFYQYRDGNKYLKLDDVNSQLVKVVSDYLDMAGLDSSDLLIQYKIGLLCTLFDNKVICAHAKIHNDKQIKFDAANQTPISLVEIEACLKAEFLDETDENIILNRFRRNLIERTDVLIEINKDNDDINLLDILSCRNSISKMDLLTLKRLFYSKNPSLVSIDINGFGNDTVDQYLEIIEQLKDLDVSYDLPHYNQYKHGSYLPTAIKLRKLNTKIDLMAIQNNVESLRENPVVQDVLYDYNNLIVEMGQSPFYLNQASEITGRFFDVSDDIHNNRLTKINNVRFISLEDVQDEFND